MRKINVNKVIDEAKFNRYFLIIFVLLLLALIFDGYDMGIYGVTLPSVMKELNLNATQTGLLASAGMFGMMFGALLFGMLSDVIGRKKTIIIGIFVYSVFNGIVAFIHSASIFAVVRFIAGMGMGALTPVVISLLSEYTPRSRRTLLLTMVMVGIPLGQLVASLAGVAFLESIGWRVLYLATLIALIMIAFVVWNVPESMKFYVPRGETKTIKKVLAKANPDFEQTEEDVYELSIVNQQKASLGSLFKSGYAKNTIYIWIAFFCNLYLFFGISTWLPKLMTMLGYPLKSSVMFLAIFLLGGVLTTPFVGMLGDKYGYKKVMPVLYAMSAVLVSLLSFQMSTFIFYTLLFLAGCAVTLVQSMTLAAAPDFYPIAFRGTAMGWGSAVSRLGSAVAPTVVGVLLTANLPVRGVFLTFIIPAVIACIAILLTKKDPDLVG
ncbi:MFS transporter [Desulfitobacterium hafniense]|nr:MFS transporter [Desulfitobacterium hafniense]ACL19897.1 major facilitator superfamily MFS_1 [Desulfitobacterium hafniense DCB-2]MEA5025341.1 MFS transporter [Desulfitobacterium hafniense]